MVEGHLAEQVVAHVRVGDVVDNVVDDGAERPVNGAKGSPEPVPLTATEVRHEDVCVLQVGDEHQVGVGDHVRHDVVLAHGEKAERVDGVADAAEGGEEADVGGDDVHAVTLFEHLAGPCARGWATVSISAHKNIRVLYYKNVEAKPKKPLWLSLDTCPVPAIVRGDYQ